MLSPLKRQHKAVCIKGERFFRFQQLHIIPLAKFLIQRGGDLQFVQIQRCADPRDANLRGVDTGAGSEWPTGWRPGHCPDTSEYSRP